jgi:F-type H+-transporting ATPase subunit c
MIKAVFSFLAVFLTAGVALAADGGASSSMLPLGMGFGIGIAVLGGALGQGKIGSAALEGIARNPNAADKVFVPMILGLAFVESLVLFAWVLMFMIK